MAIHHIYNLTYLSIGIQMHRSKAPGCIKSPKRTQARRRLGFAKLKPTTVRYTPSNPVFKKKTMNNSSDFWENLYQHGQQQTLEDGPLSFLHMNQDLRSRAQVNCAAAPWMASPSAGVRRIVLERVGGEITTRATSLVAYRPGSRFAAHSHPKGEEIFVLNGVFSDESGDFPTGSYLRNPPGSAHAPFSQEGCLIFVKLQQFSEQDRCQLALSAKQTGAQWSRTPMTRRVLFERSNERVELIHFRQAALLPPDLSQRGFEMLVLKGEVTGATGSCPIGTWMRCAPSRELTHLAQAGAEIFVKTGHLDEII